MFNWVGSDEAVVQSTLQCECGYAFPFEPGAARRCGGRRRRGGPSPEAAGAEATVAMAMAAQALHSLRSRTVPGTQTTNTGGARSILLSDRTHGCGGSPEGGCCLLEPASLPSLIMASDLAVPTQVCLPASGSWRLQVDGAGGLCATSESDGDGMVGGSPVAYSSVSIRGRHRSANRLP